MRNIILSLLFCCAAVHSSRAQLTYALASTVLDIDVVLDSDRVNIPWEILWGPDDRLWMTDGPLITRWDPLTDVVDTLLDRGHGNGLGMALHPDFPATPILLAVFDTATYYGGGHLCEVSRFTYDAVNDTLIDEQVLFTYYHAGEHAAGRLLFDTTGNVLLTTPDYYLNGPDTLFSTNGKTLRFTPDGAVPADNPRADMTWTWGHRNPQGLTMLPNGTIITSEHGMAPNANEINRIQRNNYYGWPAYDGDACSHIIPDSCVAPAYAYVHALATFGQPPSGTAFYTSDAIPEFTGKLITCILWSTGLKLFTFNAALDSITAQEYLTGAAFTDMVRNRDIAIRPDGSFYLITNDRMDARIRWIHPDPGTAVPPSDRAVEPAVLPNPVEARFTVMLPEGARNVSSEVVDLRGVPIRSAVARAGDRLIMDASALPMGLYALRLLIDGAPSTLRFIKR